MAGLEGSPVGGERILRTGNGNARLIAWKVQRAVAQAASVRYRCILPSIGLRPFGWRSVVLEGREDILDYRSVSALILVKAFSNHDVHLAEKARANAVPVIVDLCDNVLESGYGGDRYPEISANFFKITKLASALVVTGRGMRDALAGQCPSELQIVEIVDQVEREAVVDSVIRSDDWRSENSDLRLAPPPVPAAPGKARSALKKLRRAYRRSYRWVFRYSKRFVAWLALLRIRMLHRRANAAMRTWPTVLWFGTHASTTGRSGLVALADLGEELRAAYRTHPFKLLVVSDNERQFDREIAGIGVPVQYRAWHPLRMFQYIRDSDVVLLPNSRDAFSVVKSANRAVLSLSLGTPAVASMVPALEPFADCMIFDDWRNGIIRYLTERPLVDLHVKKAQRVIETLYSGEHVAKSWNDLLSKVTDLPNPSSREASR